MKDAVIGIDMGGTNTAIGLVDCGGEILTQTSLPTKQFASPEEFVRAIAEACHDLEEGLGEAISIRATGVGAPNGNYYSGEIADAPNLRWRGRIRLGALMEAALGVPCVLTNDANAAALGEMIYGNAQGMKHFMVVTIGTGLGSGIVVDGEIVYGKTGFAGELGHTTAVRWGRRCSCGKDGCLEAYVSARGLKQTAIELLTEQRSNSLLLDIPAERLNAKAIYDAATKQDAVAIEAFHRTGDILGATLADAVNYTSPEAIFLFGGISKAGDFLLRAARQSLDENLLNIFRGTVTLLPSALNDRNGAILGAAALARKEYCLD